MEAPEPVPTPIEQADELMAYLKPEIEQGRASATATMKQVKYKQLGFSYIAACKDLATQPDGSIDLLILKDSVLTASVLLKSYHDKLDAPVV